ncbi:BAG family molecular chaperone regulator 6-like [Nicotiana tomentosiformis]|uniref:BAG domain-containing protein n=1 Tax=Nicotiana tabacum TaxID=4097 RepID=A0A1S4ADH1_TOBAC|nr:uncharacterized protein LOC104095124 [Nicotiana tomentosiformis]XP_016474725.1 PREDICTED: uncharacterized protein LOC107796465 [Nicotiana tabacum]XP_016474726.1 PREDICTED: uncharacterized protein LOC107796465 [Nicotiana tabacum]XP_016474727.1 PREDICTED: uncharacterized protein LOC107796465 [Nicotiana tabacum]XP_016474728.1 PREDICTED: uncharacterized protein LOC107796465 [Nicotiana tabacum]XP_016474729.1 PREDICTED: uncharacterized protein LOC107796465 [Nicotiana tabacum]XP_016474730.1 PREDI
MESPFYGSYWSQPTRPRYSSNMRGIPVRPIHQNTIGIKPVVQIPVHFVGSDPERPVSSLKTQEPKPDQSVFALRIQKVFRGFLVRKSLKKIISIGKEVDEIERKILCGEMAELIRRDERERLRVNETLMSLLLKLDSVRGVDSGVRDCRKAVIKKAISLQEKIDFIVSAGNQIAVEEENKYNDSDEVPRLVNQTEDIPHSTGDQDENEKSTCQSEVSDLLEQSVEAENQAALNCRKKDEKTQVEGECDAEKSDELPEVSVERGEVGDVIEGIDEEENEARLHGENESRKNRELMEKMVEENEKMMRMMNELCQRNEMQTLMLNSLAQRVTQLEKAFLCDKLKAKTKKKRHTA